MWHDKNFANKEVGKLLSLSKKGGLWKFGMILVVGLLFFIGLYAFAETPEEWKARLEAELNELEVRE